MRDGQLSALLRIEVILGMCVQRGNDQSVRICFPERLDIFHNGLHYGSGFRIAEDAGREVLLHINDNECFHESLPSVRVQRSDDSAEDPAGAALQNGLADLLCSALGHFLSDLLDSLLYDFASDLADDALCDSVSHSEPSFHGKRRIPAAAAELQRSRIPYLYYTTSGRIFQDLLTIEGDLKTEVCGAVYDE